jgi:hypothetical protein
MLKAYLNQIQSGPALTIGREPGSMLKQKLSKTMRAAVDFQPGPSHFVGRGNRREAGDTCHGSVRLTDKGSESLMETINLATLRDS